MQIVYEADAQVDQQAAWRVADRLGIERSAVHGTGQFPHGEPVLLYRGGCWQLQAADGKHLVEVDFLAPRWQRRLRPANLNGEHLVRALRGRQRDLHGNTVLDATAGLGGDSLLLAAAGFDVMLVERLPVLVYLLEQAITAAAGDDALAAVISRMTPVQADSIEFMASLKQAGKQFDFVYLDPMYAVPPTAGQPVAKKRTAAPRKEMVMLQALGEQLRAGGDDAGHLLELALQVARRKVVVKRPLHAASLGDRPPTSALSGRAARFDIYAI